MTETRLPLSPEARRALRSATSDAARSLSISARDSARRLSEEELAATRAIEVTRVEEARAHARRTVESHPLHVATPIDADGREHFEIAFHSSDGSALRFQEALLSPDVTMVRGESSRIEAGVVMIRQAPSTSLEQLEVARNTVVARALQKRGQESQSSSEGDLIRTHGDRQRLHATYHELALGGKGLSYQQEKEKLLGAESQLMRSLDKERKALMKELDLASRNVSTRLRREGEPETTLYDLMGIDRAGVEMYLQEMMDQEFRSLSAPWEKKDGVYKNLVTGEKEKNRWYHPLDWGKRAQMYQATHEVGMESRIRAKLRQIKYEANPGKLGKLKKAGRFIRDVGVLSAKEVGLYAKGFAVGLAGLGLILGRMIEVPFHFLNRITSHASHWTGGALKDVGLGFLAGPFQWLGKGKDEPSGWKERKENKDKKK